MIDNLRPVFDGHIPVFAVDSEAAHDTLRSRGVETIRIDEVLHAPPVNVVVVVCDLETMRWRSRSVREALARSRSLVLPICSFDPSPRAVGYTIDMLLECDFERAVLRSRHWSDILTRHPSPLVFRRPDVDFELSCHLLGDLRVSAQTDLTLRPGDWVSAARYFEVEMEYFDAVPRYFSLRGELLIDGMLTAKSQKMPPELDHLHDRTNAIIEGAGATPGLLCAAGNRLVSLTFGSVDLGPEILTLSGGSYDSNFVEFSIGTNSPSYPVDWSVNSLLNEGLEGIHVALGDGIEGAHIDLVSTGTRLVL